MDPARLQRLVVADAIVGFDDEHRRLADPIVIRKLRALIEHQSEVGLIGRRHREPSCAVRIALVLSPNKSEHFGIPATRFVAIRDMQGDLANPQH